jgi:hypothetical protein
MHTQTQSRIFVAIDPKSIIRAEEVRQILEVHRAQGSYAVLPLHETDLPFERTVQTLDFVREAAHYQAQRILTRYHLDTSWCVIVYRSAAYVRLSSGAEIVVPIDIAHGVNREGYIARTILNDMQKMSRDGKKRSDGIHRYASHPITKPILLDALINFALITLGHQYADEPA